MQSLDRFHDGSMATLIYLALLPTLAVPYEKDFAHCIWLSYMSRALWQMPTPSEPGSMCEEGLQ